MKRIFFATALTLSLAPAGCAVDTSSENSEQPESNIADEQVGTSTQALAPWEIPCVVNTWVSAAEQYSNMSDKMKHCIASCETAKQCGGRPASEVAVLKEAFDLACKVFPAAVKEKLKRVSACGGWDSADMEANADGIRLGKENVESCYFECCTIYGRCYH